jgi:hypothetical protein
VEIEFGLCDQQVLLRAGGREMFRYEYTRAIRDSVEALHPLAIGSAGTGLEVSDLRVWRDIYYLEPKGTGRNWQAEAPLPKGKLALLGDNASVSIDSRQWLSGVPGTSIRGLVYRPFWTQIQPLGADASLIRHSSR